MKILFLATHLNSGGITSYLFTLAKEFVRGGQDIFIASSGGNMEDDFTSIGVKLLTLNIRTKSELSPKIYLALPYLKKYIQENNIEVIHSNTRITQIMGFLLGKLSGRPYVSTCHGYFKKRLSRRLAPCWGDAVIAISEAVQAHLEDDFGVSKEKIVLIRSGIGLDEFFSIDKEKRGRNRRQFNLTDEPVIGIIARLSDVKGQDILVSAMRKVVEEVPEARLLIAGQGKMEGILKKMVTEMDLTGNVIFSPLINKTAELLSVLDVFVMPSRQEGLGLSVMEAQAAGLPVVASDVGGIPSLIKNRCTGLLVRPENVNELAVAIIKLLRDKPLADKIGSASRQYAEQHYSSGEMAEKMLRIYGELILR